jgi:large subunit ribosomal protein L24
MTSKLPRKQRKALYTATQHKRARQMSVHLSDALMKKYNVRSIPVRKGDIVKVVRGNGPRPGRDEKKVVKGKEGKVVEVFLESRRIAIEGLNIAKADKKEVARKIHASNVILTNPDMSDKWRMKKLGVRE